MTTLILPGLNGSGPGHWQHHWLGLVDDAVLVDQRSWDRPTLSEWMETAATAVDAHPGSILVGHSMGAILIAHLATRYPDLPIGAAMLVAPADVEALPPSRTWLADFAPIPRRRLAFPSVVVGSRNDPWMRLEQARSLADHWGSYFVDLGSAGHINAASGLGHWQTGLAILANLKRAVRSGRAAPAFARPVSAATAESRFAD